MQFDETDLFYHFKKKRKIIARHDENLISKMQTHEFQTRHIQTDYGKILKVVAKLKPKQNRYNFGDKKLQGSPNNVYLMA